MKIILVLILGVLIGYAIYGIARVSSDTFVSGWFAGIIFSSLFHIIFSYFTN